jgi:hypothetical protein
MLTASVSPTSWAIVAGDPGHNFAISNAGQITTAVNNLATGSQVLTVQATNATGSGTGTVTLRWTSSSVTLTGDWQYYPSDTGYFPQSSGPYWLYVQPWGKPSGWVQGADYFESVTAYPPTFPNGSKVQYFWRSDPARNGNIKSATGLGWGNYYDNAPPNSVTPLQINSIRALTVTYNLSNVLDSSNNSDVIFDGYMQVLPHATHTSRPAIDQDQEWSIFLHFGPGFWPFLMSLTPRFTWTDMEGRAWYFAAHGGQKCAWLQKGLSQDLYEGTIDLKAMFQQFVVLGMLTETRFFTGFMLCPEPTNGTGTLTYNSIAVTYS